MKTSNALLENYMISKYKAICFSWKNNIANNVNVSSFEEFFDKYAPDFMKDDYKKVYGKMRKSLQQDGVVCLGKYRWFPMAQSLKGNSN